LSKLAKFISAAKELVQYFDLYNNFRDKHHDFKRPINWPYDLPLCFAFEFFFGDELSCFPDLWSFTITGSTITRHPFGIPGKSCSIRL